MDVQLSLFEVEKIPQKYQHIKESLACKLLNEGITADNYTQEKAMEVINRCCGVAILTYMFKNYECEIINQLIPNENKIH